MIKPRVVYWMLLFGQFDLNRSDRVMWPHFFKPLETTILKIGMVKQTFQINVYRIRQYFLRFYTTEPGYAKTKFFSNYMHAHVFLISSNLL